MSSGWTRRLALLTELARLPQSAHLDLAPGFSVAMHFGCFPLTDEGIDEPAAALEQARAAHGVPAAAFRVPVPGETIRVRAAEFLSASP